MLNLENLRDHLQRSEKGLIVGIFLFLAGACVTDYYVGGNVVLYGIAAVVFVIFALYVYDRRRVPAQVNEWLKNETRQLEALVSLNASLRDGTAPLPDTRGWAASPDLLKLTAELIHQQRPDLIVEAGSGVSTIVYGQILQERSGEVLSLEHERTYYEKNIRLVEAHGLEDTCCVRHAPLVPQSVDAEKWQWYDLADIHFDRTIDLLFTDGPPERVQTLSRYPAVPLLFDNLSDEAVIVLDDGGRDEEEEIVRRWTQEFPSLEAEYYALEKGAFVLRREH
jgi:hypothetical protein